MVSFTPVSPPRPYTPPLLTHTRQMPSPSHSYRFFRLQTYRFYSPLRGPSVHTARSRHPALHSTLRLRGSPTQHMAYLLTPWCRVLLEKVTVLHLVKKFPAFHGTRRFITALTSVRHLSLSWASPIQSLYTHPTSWRYILL